MCSAHRPNNFDDIKEIKLTIITFIKDLLHASRCMFSEVSRVVNTCNTSSQCNKRGVIRAIMSQKQLHHLVILHVRKECTDVLNFHTVANEFYGVWLIVVFKVAEHKRH